MAMPFERQSWEQLRARLPAAFERVWDAVYINRNRGQVDRPGLHPENVFDTIDGWRLIISRERSHDDNYLHVSASLNNSTSDIARWQGRIRSKEQAIAVVLGQFKTLTQLEATGVAQVEMTAMGVFHFVYPMPSSMVPAASRS